MEEKREKTISRSFRLKESAFIALEQEARRRNISVNTLHNLIMVGFSEYGRYIDEFHGITLSTSTFRRVLETASDEALIKAGRETGTSVPKSFLLAKYGRISPELALSYLRLEAQYASLFEFNMVGNEREMVVTLVHAWGRKGSLFFSEATKSLFEELGYKVKVKLEDSSFTLEMSKRDSGAPIAASALT